MTDQSQTTRPLTAEERAKLIHNGLAKRRGLPLWEECDDEVRAMWIKAVEDMDEVARGITYED